MAANNLKRLIWFMSYMARHPHGVTKKTLDVAWINSGMGKDDAKILPRQTLYNLIEGVGNAFGVNIIYDMERKLYVIEEIDCLEESRFKMWLVDSFSVLGLVNGNKAIEKHIEFETVAGGRQYLELMVQAIIERRTVKIEYDSVIEDECQQYEIVPYLLKLYNRRWYVISRITPESYSALKEIADVLALEQNRPYLSLMLGDNSRLWMFALDEIEEAELTSNNYEIPEDFNSKDLTGNVVGTSLFYTHIDEDGSVNTQDNGIFGDVREVIYIKAKYAAGEMLMRTPLHSSQELFGRTRGEDFLNTFMVFKYNLHPTPDFYHEILRYGAALEVIAPESVRNTMKSMIEKMLAGYNRVQAASNT